MSKLPSLKEIREKVVADVKLAQEKEIEDLKTYHTSVYNTTMLLYRLQYLDVSLKNTEIEERTAGTE